jgi:cation diffusion facilitator CzcD-associated flavoprotein CzcO
LRSLALASIWRLDKLNRKQPETLIIGAGQAGLAVGYHLRRRGLPFVIVDEHERVGDVWRKRWDTLRLFTPRRYSGLPGMPFPGPASAHPTKDETAVYFENYAREFGLSVRTGLRVERVVEIDGRFQAFCGEQVFQADNVVIATGAFHHPTDLAATMPSHRKTVTEQFARGAAGTSTVAAGTPAAILRQMLV